MNHSPVSSGIPALDEVLQGLRPGDNVVLQVDNLDDYRHFVEPFVSRAIADGRKCVYLRFAPHDPVLEPRMGLDVVIVDPRPGFDLFSAKVHRIIEERGKDVFYVFDNLSALVEEWATDELLANFFQVTCPYLFELDTVTYFALTRGRHSHSAVARIRDTTQILLDIYHVKGRMYVHPLKVWDRYSPQMFLPHAVTDGGWVPVFQSGDAAALSSVARRQPLGVTSGTIAPWESVYRKLVQYRESGEQESSELDALKLEFSRMILGPHPEFNELADRYLTLDDLFGIRNRLIGTGRIGGKAAGMLLARRILLSEGCVSAGDVGADPRVCPQACTGQTRGSAPTVSADPLTTPVVGDGPTPDDRNRQAIEEGEGVAPPTPDKGGIVAPPTLDKGGIVAPPTLDKGGIEGGFRDVLESHDSFYIGSDVFFTFLVNNDLFRLRLQMTRSSQITRDEFEGVEERFLQGKFPHAIMEQFRSMLDYFGQAPIIVRSSSLLEDSFGNAFAGKYASVFCANQGSPEERMEAFLNAVRLVYASALNPDALSYRRHRGLGERDEQMAILVQRVSGMPFGHYFFPSAAGVAFSRNLYSWSDRIDPEQGVIRLVFGLGTRAVERVGNDYPRMIAVSAPQLRPEIGYEIAKYSQRQVDLLDLEANELVTRPVAEVLAQGKYPNLHLLVSVQSDDHISDPISAHVDGSPQNWILTFNNLIRRTDFVTLIGEMVSKLEKAYGHPVDTEFTAHVDSEGRVRINLLQCRPLFLPGSAGPVAVPDGISAERTVFRSSRMISGGVVRDIRYVVYIDPRRYAAQPTDTKKMLGRLVGRINAHPQVIEGKVLMMGPGRWGSSNIDLGVNVGYADIDNTAVLVEVAREEAGQVPELSYGTHFFQDLVEAQIIYLPVYPDDPEAQFNGAFLDYGPNALGDLLPDAAGFEHLLRLIDIPAAANGARVHVVADPQARRAICFLA